MSLPDLEEVVPVTPNSQGQKNDLYIVALIGVIVTIFTAAVLIITYLAQLNSN